MADMILVHSIMVRSGTFDIEKWCIKSVKRAAWAGPGFPAGKRARVGQKINGRTGLKMGCLNRPGQSGPNHALLYTGLIHIHVCMCQHVCTTANFI